jgi:hypothetical protein
MKLTESVIVGLPDSGSMCLEFACDLVKCTCALKFLLLFGFYCHILKLEYWS